MHALRPKLRLHDEVKTQLGLAHSWLEEKNKSKAQLDRPSAITNGKWEGIYHDNGSCIDIVGPFGSDVQVLVLRIEPLIITDGRHYSETSLTSTCRDNLRAQFPVRRTVVGTVWAVRKYTIDTPPTALRATSFSSYWTLSIGLEKAINAEFVWTL